jgi:Tfp pilus assembly protein PilO
MMIMTFDWHADIEQWPFLLKISMIVGMALCIFCIGYYILVSDTQAKLKAGVLEQDHLKKQYQKKLNEQQEIAHLKDRIKNHERFIETLMSPIGFDFFDHIIGLKKTCGLLELSFKTHQVHKKYFFSKTDFRLMAKASPVGIQCLVEAITLMSDFVVMEQFQMKSKNQNKNKQKPGDPLGLLEQWTAQGAVYQHAQGITAKKLQRKLPEMILSRAANPSCSPFSSEALDRLTPKDLVMLGWIEQKKQDGSRKKYGVLGQKNCIYRVCVGDRIFQSEAQVSAIDFNMIRLKLSDGSNLDIHMGSSEQ